nr:hypothetical protein [Thermomonas carbonis]
MAPVKVGHAIAIEIHQRQGSMFRLAAMQDRHAGECGRGQVSAPVAIQVAEGECIGVALLEGIGDIVAESGQLVTLLRFDSPITIA